MQATRIRMVLAACRHDIRPHLRAQTVPHACAAAWQQKRWRARRLPIRMLKQNRIKGRREHTMPRSAAPHSMSSSVVAVFWSSASMHSGVYVPAISLREQGRYVDSLSIYRWHAPADHSLPVQRRHAQRHARKFSALSTSIFATRDVLCSCDSAAACEVATGRSAAAR